MRAVGESDFSSGDRLDAEREGGVAESMRLGEDLVERRRDVEKRICGVTMELGVGCQAVCMNHSWVTRFSKRTTRAPPSSITAKYRREMSCLHHSSSILHISRTVS